MGELVRLPPRPHRDPAGSQPEPLWRELVGAELRAERQSRGDRLTDVADRAGVSPQYLSEVERGLKDPSSEILAAVAGALDLTVRQLTIRVAQAAPRPTSLRPAPQPTSPRGTTLCLVA